MSSSCSMTMRVAQVAQAQQRVDEAAVVALVQADAGLVENVEHADERASDLRREPNALRLAARKRRCRTRERKIAETDAREKSQARANLLDDLMRDLLLALGERKRCEERLGLLDRAARQRVDVRAADRHGEGFWLEPGALADRADRRRHVLLDVFLDVLARRLAVTALQVVDDAFERRPILPRLAGTRGVRKLLLAFGSIEDEIDHLVAHLVDRRRRFHAMTSQHALELLQVVRVHRRVLAGPQRPAPRRDRALGNRFRAVGDDFPRIDFGLDAQAGAGRARAVRRVEREETRRQLFKGNAAVDASEGLAERQLSDVVIPSRPRSGRVEGRQRGEDAARKP